MVDLIIPVYKNKAGLYRTLMSVGTELKDQVLVTIVDDASGETYDDIIQLFQKIFPIRILYLEENSGPGIARNLGLSQATQKWVCFIDCGDTFLTPTTLFEMIHECELHDDLWMASWAHQEEFIYDGEEPGLPYVYGIVGSGHNRMHGKIYRRQFLMNYNIQFCTTCPRANEDIGFNLCARLICQNASLQDGLQHIYEFENPAVVWKVTGPSVVRANNCEFYYRRQNSGMAQNAMHALQKAYEYNVDRSLILREIYEEICHMYFFYLITLNGRPEFIEESLQGALYYYCNAFRDVKDENPDLLRIVYYNTLNGFLNDTNNDICKTFTKLDFLGFIDMLEEKAQPFLAQQENIIADETPTQEEKNNFQFEGLT